MNHDLQFILCASFGAFVQEVLHYFDLRHKLELKRYQQLFHSSLYWIITFLMIVVSGIGTYLLFDNEIDPHKKNIQFILGAAFPLLFKKAVGSATESKLGGPTLGTKPLKVLLRSYFQ